jgi:hypothetical protein
MGRTKGTPKTGGRQAGTPNKVTGTMKEFPTNIIDENREQIRKDLKALEPKDRLAMLERFMQYVTPKNHEEAQLPMTLPPQIVLKYVGDKDCTFPSSEDEVDMG